MWNRNLLFGAIFFAVFPAVTNIWACGPFFPNQVLIRSNEQFLSLPSADFEHEVALIPDRPRSPFKAFSPEQEKVPAQVTPTVVPLRDRDITQAQLTAAADLADLRLALREMKVSSAREDAILQQYEAARNALQQYADKLERWKKREDARKNESAPQLPVVNIPSGLPPEFADYLRGAIAWHKDDFNSAAKAWTDLLARPENQRQYRSTWAKFMLGRLPGISPTQVARLMQGVRQLASQGFRDRLGLAADSYGWEAKPLLDSGRYEPAIALYLQQYATGDTTAIPSLQRVTDKVLHDKPEVMDRVSHEPLSRGVILAFLVSHGGPHYPDIDNDLAIRWLQILEKTGQSNLLPADRLAWAAYQRGRMDLAQRWLKLAPASSPWTQWVKAKLAMRSGDMKTALQALVLASAAFPVEEKWYAPDLSENVLGTPAQATSLEAGAIKLTRGQYTEALHWLLKGDSWADAAYVAERVLTADELKGYVDANWTVRRVNKESDVDIANSLRHLLARRLTRMGRWKEARPYFPLQYQASLDAYIAAIRTGNDPKQSINARIGGFWEAARIARWEGMELMGTEQGPDNALYGGDFDANDPPPEIRKAGSLVASSADEIRRALLPSAQPMKRYHYRYVAADHAWEAAKLMPDNSVSTARVLCEAGGWIKNLDPKAADRFYKDLVLRCPQTPLGREAAQVHWFPKNSVTDNK